MANDIRINVDYPETGGVVNGVQYMPPDGQSFEEVEAALLALKEQGWETEVTNPDNRIKVEMYEGSMVYVRPGVMPVPIRLMDKVLYAPESHTLEDVMAVMASLGYQRIDNYQGV